MEDPDTYTLAERAMKVTGCTDKTTVTDMAETLRDINERCWNHGQRRQLRSKEIN